MFRDAELQMSLRETFQVKEWWGGEERMEPVGGLEYPTLAALCEFREGET